MGNKRGVVPGHFKVQGHAVEDRDTAHMSKQALDRDRARYKRTAGKAKRSAKPKPQRLVEPPRDSDLPTASVLARAHDREFAKMNERQRKAPKRVKSAAGGEADQPRYLADAARGLLRRVARYAMAPLALARAVVDRLRDRD
jgi:hypothetical protein